MIDERKAYTYFKNRFVMRKSTNGFFIFNCPFCIRDDDKKHAVNFGWERTKCWKCGFAGYITDFVQDYEGVDYFRAKDIIHNETASAVDLEIFENIVVETKRSDLALPTGFNSILSGEGTLGIRARNYLEKRGFDLAVLDQIGFGYCREHAEDKKEDYFGYIIVPFKRRGQLQYFIGRDYTGNWLRYKNPSTETFGIGKEEIIFNEDALELSSINFIAEGWSDAMTMGRAGTSTQGWSMSTIQKDKYFKSSAGKFIFLPDIGESEQGTSFYKQAVKLALEFIDHKECVVIDFQSAGYEQYGKDVNEFGKQRVLDLIKKTKPLTEGRAMDIIMS